MDKIELNLPPGVIVKGELYSTDDPAYLVQDLLEIELPNGLTIDVGWYPESDPSGSFQIVIFKDYWENQLRDPFETKSISDLISALTHFVAEYLKPQVTTACSSTTSGRLEDEVEPTFKSSLAAAA